ncbi:MAG TPA: type II toxin-antitoxin system Phd/YefM family antitoxin [Thermoanaerobaculia bacterium]|nr:type II toxin-antitoxin system Phd/YefM family antitoxin [Thermoanaerobaculia bacterium]
MVKTYSIAEARDNLTSVVQEAEEGTQVELTRQGKPVAVLVGVEDFERLSKKKPGFWEAYQEFRRTADLSELDPDEIFRDVRDQSPGRDFNW